MQAVIDYLRDHSERFVREMFQLLRIPSVSADQGRKHEMLHCAEVLAEQIKAAGVHRVEVMLTDGHPLVYAEHKGPVGAPTVLIYGHYDVQPEDPLELWTSPPFEPEVRGDDVYARGSADDKGQLLIHVKAVEAFLAVSELPLNVKMIFEGEEEIGSPSLPAFIAENRELLAADVVVVSDSGMFAKGCPSITYGLRGLTYMQLDLVGPAKDLHSGSFGGAVANPGNVLAQIVGSLVDQSGHVTIPGFYDQVREPTEFERAAFAKLPFDEAGYISELGALKLHGEAGYTTLERTWARPTCDVNGMLCGFTGEGAKTVLPSKASAKVSMRLVPDQDPDQIAELFERHVRSICPDSVRLEVTKFHGGSPFLCPPDSPEVQAAARALSKGFGSEAYYIREGGSIPIVTVLAEQLDAPVVLMGFGLPDENAHAPDEHFHLPNFYNGLRSVAYFFEELAQLKG
ncbi:MAG: dipeptidase [Candidatus Alcyoniella australis]|nr:dipeptidase [Candidatus Alcyoniella australis]